MAELLKNIYNEKYIQQLAFFLKSNYKDFNKKKFISEIFNKEWQNRALKNRMRHIALTMNAHLSKNYIENISLLKTVFSNFKGQNSLENMIFQDFVEVYGLDDFNTSMQALEHFTINSSSEFAIRQFIIKYPTKTMQQMCIWAESKNHHVRRLASEGSRPRLPWAIALPSFKKNPQEVLKILELLKDDSSDYVRKSVANTINDISKDNPAIVKNLTQSWIGQNKNRDWILKHGCRTLLKQSDTQTLAFFGFDAVQHIKLEDFVMPENVLMGKDLSFSFLLHAKENLGKLRIEFAIDFLRKNNKHNTKVFKLSEGVYKTNSREFSKKY